MGCELEQRLCERLGVCIEVEGKGPHLGCPPEFIACRRGVCTELCARPNVSVQALIPITPERGCTWRWGYAKLRPLGWALTQSDWCP